MKVLKELGVEADDERPIIEVFNKIDLMEPEVRDAMLLRNRARSGEQIAVSALTGAGTDDLFTIIDDALGGREQAIRLSLSPEDGAGLAWAHSHGRVIERRDSETGMILVVAGEPDVVEKFHARFPGQVKFHQIRQRRRA